jgi:hypothetical protein
MAERISLGKVARIVLFVKAYAYGILVLFFLSSEAPSGAFTPFVVHPRNAGREEALERARVLPLSPRSV